jgi:hypothetical protein
MQQCEERRQQALHMAGMTMPHKSFAVEGLSNFYSKANNKPKKPQVVFFLVGG